MLTGFITFSFVSARFFVRFFFKLRQLYTTSKFQINRRFVFFVYIRQRFLQFVLLSEIRIQINSFILTPPIRIQKKNKKNHYVRKTSYFTFINDPIPPQPFSTYSIYMSNHFWEKNILKKKQKQFAKNRISYKSYPHLLSNTIYVSTTQPADVILPMSKQILFWHSFTLYTISNCIYVIFSRYATANKRAFFVLKYSLSFFPLQINERMQFSSVLLYLIYLLNSISLILHRISCSSIENVPFRTLFHSQCLLN